MIGYVKDRNTFATLDMLLDISQYDLIIGSVNNNVGTVLVTGELTGLENQFFIYENRLWIIKSLAPEDGRTTITLYDISYLFSRDLVWDENAAYTTIEECIADVIDTEYINLSDTAYDTPYISVTYSTATSFIMPDFEGNLWNLKGYIAKVRRMKNVFLSYTINGNQLDIEIEQRTPAVWKIDFATDTSQMVQEIYQKTATAKVSANASDGTITDYYLYTDGTISTNPSLYGKTRETGDWAQLQIRDNEVEADRVEDLFSKNSESRIIEFYTTEPVDFYDTVLIRHDGRVTSGTLSVVSISSEDSRTYCKTGDLINNVPDAISMLATRVETVTKRLDGITDQGLGDDISVLGNITAGGSVYSTGDIYEGGQKLSDKYGGGTSQTLLYTNNNTGSNFGAQTIPLSETANNFDWLIVVCRAKTNKDMRVTAWIQTSGKGLVMSAPYDGSSEGLVGRTFNVNGTSVSISAAYAVGSGTTFNQFVIPEYIYGLKY